MSVVAWTFCKEHGWVTANCIKTANTWNHSSFSTRRYNCQLRAATGNTSRMAEKDTHSSPRNINFSPLEFDTLGAELCNWTDITSPCRNMQTLSWETIWTHQKEKQIIQVSSWPLDSKDQQSESINMSQLLCWFAIMLLFYFPQEL